jgi:toxin-antitoxin system PIN domain toxin
MKLIDANVLLYAVNADAREHARAKSWMEATLSDVEPVAFAWVAMLAFLRIATRGGLFAKPLKLPKAFDLLQAWLGARNVQILHPTRDHLAILRILLKPGTNASLVTDAHLAALAIEHGAELVSFDRDFARFDGLRTSILTV